jgi:hypothetical protein
MLETLHSGPPAADLGHEDPELFVYGCLCWLLASPPSTQVLFDLVCLEEYVRQNFLNERFICRVIQSCQARPLAVTTVLDELHYCSPRIVFPSSSRLYGEQVELLHLFMEVLGDPDYAAFVVYKAPPAGGKTSTAALLAALAQRAGENVVFCCNNSCVQRHFELHLEAASSPALQRAAPADICTTAAAGGLLSKGTCAALFIDEANSGTETEQAALLATSPRFVVLMSSTPPRKAWLQAQMEMFKERFPGAIATCIASRRLHQNYTAKLMSGAIVAPHHYGLTLDGVRGSQHLLRFYSPVALRACLEYEDLCMTYLDAPLLCSARGLRLMAMRLLGAGLLHARRALPSPEEHAALLATWRSEEVWRAVADAPGLALLYTHNAREELERTAKVWLSLFPEITAASHEDVYTSASDVWPQAALVRGIGALGMDTALDAHCYRRAQVSDLRCLMIGPSTSQGLHLPVTRLVLLDAPDDFEAAVHVCGRVGRDHATTSCVEIVMCSDHEAHAIMTPPARYQELLHTCKDTRTMLDQVWTVAE